MPPAVGTKPFAVFAAQGLGWKRQQHLLPQDVLQQDPIFLIITDFGLGGSNGMLRSLAIGADGAKKQVELSRNRVFHRVEATGAEHLEAAVEVRAQADVFDELPGPAVFDDQLCLPLELQRADLANVGSVVDLARRQAFIQWKRLVDELCGGDEHGLSVGREGARVNRMHYGGISGYSLEKALPAEQRAYGRIS